MNAIFTQARPVRPPNSDPIVFSDEHWQLIERCWTQSADLRPPFSEIADTLNRMSLEVKSVVRGNTIRLSKDKENDDNSYKTATSVPIATSIPVSAAVYTVQHEPTYLDTSPYQLSSSPNSVLKAVTPVPKINNSTNPFLNIPEPIPINTSTSSPIPNAISFKTQYNSYNEYRHGTSDIKAYADAQKPSNQPTTMYSDVFVSFTAPNSTPCSLAVLEGSTTRLFSGYENGLIREWDVDKSRIIRTFVGHNSRVNSLTVTEYPPRLYSGSSDNTVREWNLQTGGIQVYDAHITDVNSVAVVSGEIPQLFSGSADNTIRKWNVLYGNSEKILYGHNSAVCALVSVPGESNRLFSGSDDFSVLEWKVSTGQSVRGFVGHSDCVSSIAVLPGSPIRLFSGSFDKSIIEWDLKTGKPLDKFFGHTQKITTITVLGGNPPRLFSGSADQTIREWNLETRTITRVYRGHTDEITSVVAIGTVSPRLFSSSRDGSVKDWVVPLEQPVTTRKLDTENDAILASELDRQLNLEIIKEQPLVEIQEKKKPKDKMLKSMHHPEWYKTSIAEARILPKGEHYPDSTINAIAILTSSPPALFVGCEDRMIRQIDFMSGRVLRVFAGHRGWISSIALYPNQSFPMLSGSSDRTVKEWSLYSGACTRTYVGHKEPVTSVVYVTGPCYNQFQFFSASLDKTIREWDRQTGQSVRIFSQSKDEIYAIAALSHSHHPRLFSSSKDSTITEWDYHSGQQVRLFTAHSNSLVAMSILYLDQRSIYLYSASADGLIREWNLGDYQSRIISEIAGNVTSLASFHTPPYRLYSSSNDNLIKEWDITQVKVIPDTKNPRVKLVAQKGFQF
ncbi:hypothetical protein HK098_005094 [Nowakowskiella sp. JEL0407]|nr:hypothetical protein HK098_005094 [Nowakowskiella sp. JEL0407]